MLKSAVLAYERGDLEEAQHWFEQAHAVQSTARTLRGLGVVAYRRGLNALAYSLLTQSLSSTHKPLTDELRGRVQILVAELEGKVARLLFQLQPEDAELLIDGEPPLRDGSGVVVIEAGEHQAHLRAHGYAEARWDFVVTAGSAQQRNWQLASTLRPTPSQTASAASAAAVGAPTSTPAPSSAPPLLRWKRTGYASLALAAAGIVVTAVAIGLGLTRVAAIEEACRDSEQGCSASRVRAESRRAKLDTLSGLATGAAVVAGMATISATWTLVKARRGEPRPRVQLTMPRLFGAL